MPTCKRILHLLNYLKADKYNCSCVCNFNFSSLDIDMIHFNTTMTLFSRPASRRDRALGTSWQHAAKQAGGALLYRSWKVPERTESRYKRRNCSCYYEGCYPSLPGLFLKTLLINPIFSPKCKATVISPPLSLLRFSTAATAAHWADTPDIHLLEKYHVHILAAKKSRGNFFLFSSLQHPTRPPSLFFLSRRSYVKRILF